MLLVAFYAILAILAVLLGLYGLCRLLLWWDGRRKARYDERQKEAQGRAYRVAFWVGAVYLFAAMGLTWLGLNVQTWLLLFLGLMGMLMTFRFCCWVLRVGNPIFHDPRISLVCDLAVMGVALAELVGALSRWFRSGVMDSRFWFAMILGICFLVQCVMDLAQLRREREA